MPHLVKGLQKAKKTRCEQTGMDILILQKPCQTTYQRNQHII
ncbi:hypothetical protein WCP94_002651 [Bilophila wadsworthia]